MAALPLVLRLPGAGRSKPIQLVSQWKLPRPYNRLVWSRDEKSLVALTADGDLSRWNLDGSEIPLPGYYKIGRRKRTFAISPDGRYAVENKTGKDFYQSYGLELIEIATGKVIQTFLWSADAAQRRIGTPNEVYFSSDGNSIACLADVHDKRQNSASAYILALWNRRTGRRQWTRFIPFSDLVFSPQGRVLSFAPPHNYEFKISDPLPLRAYLADVQTGSRVLPLSESSVQSAPMWRSYSFSARGKWFAAGLGNSFTSPNTLFVWNFQKRRLAWQREWGKFLMTHAVFSPNERFLAVAGFYQTSAGTNTLRFQQQLFIMEARTGEIIQSHQEIALQKTNPTFLDFWPDRSVYSMAWSPDSRNLATAYFDGEIKIWASPK